ncbi:MAG: DUF3024 domain-containing protein [Nitrosomonadales bacterium]|nr:DUF3024 domain-containing protein [Nitrosomonadales bacterium]
MAFTELEIAQHKRDMDAFMKRRRPPPHIREKLDHGYRIVGQSVELFDIRPDFRNPKAKRETPFAKATYVRNKNHWRIFWMMSDLKWHGYDPNLEVKSLPRFLEVVHKDEHCCFFG